MAFTSTVTREGELMGRLKTVFGTFANNGGSTGGEVVTNLKRVLFFSAQHTGAAVVVSAPVANETFPLDQSDVTLVTVADTSGIWSAIGE